MQSWRLALFARCTKTWPENQFRTPLSPKRSNTIIIVFFCQERMFCLFSKKLAVIKLFAYYTYQLDNKKTSSNMYVITTKSTVMIWSLVLRIQTDRSLSVAIPTAAIWRKLSRNIKAFPEYSAGYFFPSLDWRMNQKDQHAAAASRATDPVTHLCAPWPAPIACGADDEDLVSDGPW